MQSSPQPCKRRRIERKSNLNEQSYTNQPENPSYITAESNFYPRHIYPLPYYYPPLTSNLHYNIQFEQTSTIQMGCNQSSTNPAAFQQHVPSYINSLMPTTATIPSDPVAYLGTVQESSIDLLSTGTTKDPCSILNNDEWSAKLNFIKSSRKRRACNLNLFISKMLFVEDACYKAPSRVPDEKKDEEYVAKRARNNESARKSRLKRSVREVCTQSELNELKINVQTFRNRLIFAISFVRQILNDQKKYDDFLAVLNSIDHRTTPVR
ncbi:hypothetical protein ACOME3_002648 [Neoechinorhynchus agilis]